MPTLDLDNELNPAQRAAVVATDGPLLILAGAGTGKTRVITWRIAHLLASGQALPSEILAVTFTNRAARELKERVAHLAGPDAAQIHVSTFHSACARWLRREGRPVGLGPSFSVLDTDDQLALIRQVAEDLHLPADATTARSYAERIDAAHQAALRIHEVHETSTGRAAETFAELFEAYERTLTRIQACDFGSLIARMVHLLEDEPRVRERFHARYRHVMVDEFQDTDPAQYRLLRALAPLGGNVAVVGDDDQSIYGWRGATVANVRAFRDDYDATVVALEQNYRSTRTILEAAHAVVLRLPDRMEKKLRTDRDDDRPITVHVAIDDREEAEWVARSIEEARAARGLRWQEIAVFYRANAQSRVIEERLRARGLPYTITGGVSFYERREVRDVLAWLRILANPSDDVAFRRIVQAPPRGIGRTTLQQLESARRDGHATTLRDALARHATFVRKPAARTRDALTALHTLLASLDTIARSAPANEVIEAVLQETGYLTWLGEQKDDDVEDRVRNLDDLRVSAREFATSLPSATLVDFLESVTLRAHQEDDPEAGAIQLMTVHAAKGLEFDTVFVTGLEDRQFPNLRRGATMEDADLEEERRLWYVAVTRARTQLVLSAAMRRRLYGQTRPADPSPFLLELNEAWTTISRESASASADWRRSRGGWESGESRAPRRAGDARAGSGWDPLDQRAGWEEPAWDALPVVPEEGVVFDDSYYPEDSVRSARSLVGRSARHKLFGTGRILDADPVGPRVRLTIEFPAVGTKKVVADYVEILDEA